MRLICPSCTAQYAIEAEMIPPEGRDVQCSACNHIWMQRPEADTSLFAPLPDTPPQAPVKPARARSARAGESDLAAKMAALSAMAETAPRAPQAPEGFDDSLEDEFAAYLAHTGNDTPSPSTPPPSDLAEPEPDQMRPSYAPAPPVARDDEAGATLQEVIAALDARRAAMRFAPADSEETASEDEARGFGPLDAQGDDNILKRHSLDESMMAVLREEAAREAQAREEETQRRQARRRRPREEADGPRLQLAPRARPAPFEDAELAPTPEQPALRATRSARAAMLPDIEEINSTLDAAPYGTQNPEAPLPMPQGNSGFLRGFAGSLLILAVLVALYAYGAQLSAQVPALKGAIDSYVAIVDQARLWLAQIMGGGAL